MRAILHAHQNIPVDQIILQFFKSIVLKNWTFLKKEAENSLLHRKIAVWHGRVAVTGTPEMGEIWLSQGAQSVVKKMRVSFALRWPTPSKEEYYDLTWNFEQNIPIINYKVLCWICLRRLRLHEQSSTILELPFPSFFYTWTFLTIPHLLFKLASFTRDSSK